MWYQVIPTQARIETLLKPRFSISTLLRTINRLNLHHKNKKMFCQRRVTTPLHIFLFFSHIFNLLSALATSANGKSGLKDFIFT